MEPTSEPTEQPPPAGQPPQPAAQPPQPVRVPLRRARRPYVAPRPSSLEGRKKFAVATLALAAVLAGACAWAVFDVRQFLQNIPPQGYDVHDRESAARAEAVDQRSDSLAKFALVARVLCAIAFLRWFYQAHENVRTSGARRLERTSAWAVGSFFVPFLGLVLPCIAMMDVWRGSSALAGSEASGERGRRSTPALVLVWWFTFMGASLLAVVANSQSVPKSRWGPADAHPVAALVSATTWMFASRITEFVAAAVAIALVVRISAFQSRTSERLASVFE